MKTARIRAIALSCSLGVLAGSGAGCSSPKEETPLPPTDFLAQQDPTAFDRLIFSWTPPPGPITSYDAEGRAGSGPWEGLGQAIPPEAIGGVVELHASVPELTELAFRIRSVRGGLLSAWSNEARVTRGLRWPVAVASRPQLMGMWLEWSNTSRTATGVRVSRLLGSQWQVLADLPATAASYLDTRPMIADEPIHYRISATLGAEESQSSPFLSAGFPPTAVWGLTASPEAAGVHLRWSSPPIADQTFVVHRCGLINLCFDAPVTPAPLPSPSLDYVDPAPPGVYRYEVESRYANPASIRPRTVVEGIANPAGKPALAGVLVRLPQSSAVARDSGGRLAFAIGGSYYPPGTGAQSIVFDGVGAPPDHDLGTGHAWVAPSVLFDPDDHPHVMVLRPVAGDPSRAALVHAWHDGSAWSEEEVARRAFDDPGTVRFARDGGGGLHVAWTSQVAGIAEYAHNGAAGWSIEDLAPVSGLPARLLGLEVDGVDAPSILVSAATGNALLRKESGWIAEVVPADGQVTLHPTHSGLALLQVRCVSEPAPSHGEVVLLERTASGWGPESLVEEFVQCLPVDYRGLRDSPDGGRRALWVGPIGRLNLRFREDGGAWSTVDTGLASPPFVWFDPSGKVGLLVPAGGYPSFDGLLTYARYGEP